MKLVIGLVVVIIVGIVAYMNFSVEPAVAPTPDTAPVTEEAVTPEAEPETAEAETETAAEPAVATDAEAVVPTSVVETPTETEAAAETRVFDVSGSNFAFDVTEMRVKEGDTVTINFSASAGFHDWKIDEFSAATAQVRPGTPTSVTFVADKKGTFEYYCSVGSHRAQGMVGNLIVE